MIRAALLKYISARNEPDKNNIEKEVSMKKVLILLAVLGVILGILWTVMGQESASVSEAVRPESSVGEVTIVISEEPPLTVAYFAEADNENAASFTVEMEALASARASENDTDTDAAMTAPQASFTAAKDRPEEVAKWHEQRSTTSAQLDDRFQSEVADGSAALYWDAIMKTVAGSPSLSALSIRDVECRVSVCRVRVEDSNRDTFLAHGMMLTSQFKDNRTLAALGATSMDFDSKNGELTVYLGTDDR